MTTAEAGCPGSTPSPFCLVAAAAGVLGRGKEAQMRCDAETWGKPAEGRRRGELATLRASGSGQEANTVKKRHKIDKIRLTRSSVLSFWVGERLDKC